MERTDLLNCLKGRFDIEELKTLCFEMHIDYNGFKTDNNEAFSRDLILYCERKNRYADLVERCAPNGTQNSSQTPSIKLRDSDFSVLSDCHAALLKLRNLFQNTLPVPHLEPRRMQQILEFANETLQCFPVLQRVMGKAWAEGYRDAITDVVIVSKKTSGRDLMQEVRELQDRSPDEVKAFFGEFANKTRLTELMDKLIAELEAKMN